MECKMEQHPSKWKNELQKPTLFICFQPLLSSLHGIHHWHLIMGPYVLFCRLLIFVFVPPNSQSSNIFWPHSWQGQNSKASTNTSKSICCARPFLKTNIKTKQPLNNYSLHTFPISGVRRHDTSRFFCMVMRIMFCQCLLTQCLLSSNITQVKGFCLASNATWQKIRMWPLHGYQPVNRKL